VILFLTIFNATYTNINVFELQISLEKITIYSATIKHLSFR